MCCARRGRLPQVPDSDAFDRCIEEERYKAVIDGDIAVAAELGNRLIPIVAVDGTVLSRPPSIGQLFQRIDEIVSARAIAVSPASLTTTLPVIEPISAPPELRTVVNAIRDAFADGNFQEWQSYLANEIRFDGDRDIGSMLRQKTLVEGEALGARWISAHTNRNSLIRAYETFMLRQPTEQLAAILAWGSPKLTPVMHDGQHFERARRGDWVLDLDWGAAWGLMNDGLNNDVLFVLRRVDGRFQVIAHFADY